VDADNEANYNAIIQIQNNITTVFIVPATLVRPDSGTKTYRMVVLNYDNVGNMEDFDADPTISGTYVSGGAYFNGTMTRDGVGQYHYDVSVAPDDDLGAVQVKADALEQTLPRVLIRTTEVSDYDDELSELKADTEEIISDVGMMMDTPFLHLFGPSVVVMNNGYSKVDNDTIALPIGTTEIPISEGTGDFFPDSGFIYLDDGAKREKLEYSSKTATSLVLASTTTIEHDDGASIYSVISSEIRLYIEALDKNEFHELDEAPSIVIYNEFGTEFSDFMLWDSVRKAYYYITEYIATEFLPGMRNVIVRTAGGEGGVPVKHSFATYEVLDRPASQESIDSVIVGGIMPNSFVFDHDGWKDEANILHEWNDEMAGPLHDDTGKPATGILVRAFLKGDDNKYLLVNNPPFHNYSNIFGHYRGSLEAGTYLFTFYKDNHKWKEVERTIGGD